MAWNHILKQQTLCDVINYVPRNPWLIEKWWLLDDTVDIALEIRVQNAQKLKWRVARNTLLAERQDSVKANALLRMHDTEGQGGVFIAVQ